MRRMMFAIVARTGVPQLLKKGWHHVSVDTFKDRMDETGLSVSRRYQDFLAKIPVLLAYGGADNTLDPRLNAEIFIPRFKAAGGDIKVVYRAAYGHHPHGFEVDEAVVPDFFCDAAKH